MELIHDIIETVMIDERVNDAPLREDLSKMNIPEGKMAITVVDRVITDSKGNEMYEYLGHNATTIGGTQMIAENVFDNLDPEHPMELLTVDSQTLPEHWSFPTATSNIDRQKPRKIFGVMLADDGAVGKTLKIVDRRTKAFDINRIIPFRRMDARSDNAYEYMQIGTPGVVKDTTDATLMAQIRRSIEDGKYALRANINTPGFTDVCYFVKVLKFDLQNILVDGTKLESNTSTRSVNLDVRTRIQTTIKVDRDELSSSFFHNNGTREIQGSMISSILLVAGRPTRIVAEDSPIDTYGDVIVTNRINFVELPVNEAELKFRYTIYYV